MKKQIFTLFAMLTMVFCISGCGGGGSENTPINNPPIITDKAPAAPTNLIAVAGINQASISFPVPTDNGSAITSYTVISSPDNIVVNSTATQINITGLTAGVQYTFTATATNAVGTSVSSPPSNAVTVLAPPVNTYSITGSIKGAGNSLGLAGVSVTLAGSGSTTATTDSNGNYIFAGAHNGSYTITPALAGYTFTPAAKTIAVNGMDSINNDFTAAITVVNTTGFVKNGNNFFKATRNSSGTYLGKYDANLNLLGEIPILTSSNVDLNGFFSPPGSDSIFVFSTKEVIAPGQTILNDFGEVFLTKIHASNFTITSNTFVYVSARIHAIKLYSNDLFFHILSDMGQGQYLQKVDFDGNVILNKDLWAGDYFFKFMEVALDRVYLAGYKLGTPGSGNRACIMFFDRDLNAISESVLGSFNNSPPDTVNSFAITAGDLRINVTHKDFPNSVTMITNYSVDFATGTYTPL